jgi:hypothetical protein
MLLYKNRTLAYNQHNTRRAINIIIHTGRQWWSPPWLWPLFILSQELVLMASLYEDDMFPFLLECTVLPVCTRARILKHLLEAEKSTFRIELYFQGSESTTGLQQATVFV